MYLDNEVRNSDKYYLQFSHKACLGGWWVSSKWAFKVARSGHNTLQKWHRALSENKTTKLSAGPPLLLF